MHQLSKREQVAALVMAAIAAVDHYFTYSDEVSGEGSSYEDVAEVATEYADALLKRLKETTYKPD